MTEQQRNEANSCNYCGAPNVPYQEEIDDYACERCLGLVLVQRLMQAVIIQQPNLAPTGTGYKKDGKTWLQQPYHITIITGELSPLWLICPDISNSECRDCEKFLTCYVHLIPTNLGRKLKQGGRQ